MRTIDKIKEQIHAGEIEFYGFDDILDYYRHEPKKRQPFNLHNHRKLSI